MEALPGRPAPDGRMFLFDPIESTSRAGKKTYWQVRVELVGEDGTVLPLTTQPIPAKAYGRVTTQSWQEGGEPRKGTKPSLVRKGRNIGRKNETNVLEQALGNAHGLYKKHAKQRSGPTSAADRPPPMLVQVEGSSAAATLRPEEFERGEILAQRKFNGVRLMAYCDAAQQQVVFYSRTGVTYSGLAHLREALRPLLCRPAAAGLYLDGELYKHGKPLNWISGQARSDEEAPELEYRVFDLYVPSLPGLATVQRQALLTRLLAKEGADSPVKRAENFPVRSAEELRELAARFVQEGYEGAIARRAGTPYEPGVNNYHSATLVKIKPLHDSEFPLVGFTQGTRGKDVGALIWVCEVPRAESRDEQDRLFSVVPKNMTYAERYHLFRCLAQPVDGGPRFGGKTVTRFVRDFYGVPVTVEYPERSAKTGKPVQAKATVLRTYEEGPDRDPLARLRRECGQSSSRRDA